MNSPLRALAVIGAALVLMIGGAVAYAQIPSADGTISACMLKPGGTIRLIDTEAGTTCKKGETLVEWSQGGGVSGYQKVTSTLTFNPGTGAAFGFGHQADCPPGKVALGGGGSFVEADGTQVHFNDDVTNASFPTDDNTGWIVVLTGGSFADKDITGMATYVICASS